MKPIPLSMPKRGLDVVSQESSLPKGTVRAATNVVFDNNGGFTQRGGVQAQQALAGAHSLWTSPASGRTLVAAGDALYGVDSALELTELFVGLLPDEPVEYCDAGRDIYFASRGVLAKITADAQVRRPGVADLTGARPTLTTTAGGLRRGRYGVAYSLINDLGEECGLSNIAWIDLANPAGILLTDIVTATHVVTLNVYCTTAGGGELYLARSVPIAGGATIDSVNSLGRPATLVGRAPMPWGSFVRFHKGRLWTAHGRYAHFSDAYNLGLNHTSEGYVMFPRPVTVFEPVEGGIFVGMDDRVLFLQGGDPGDMKARVASERGAAAHTGAGPIPGDAFVPDVAPDQAARYVAWRSDIGLMLGRPDGSVVPATGTRIAMSAGAGRAVFLEHNGIKQVVFPVESMTMGGSRATDRNP